MGFKLYSDSMVDRPMFSCDVCGGQIMDIWNDKATGSPGHDGQVTDVTIHHRTCQASGTVTMLLIDFIRLLVVATRPGDLGSNGMVDKVSVEYPTGRGFVA